MEHVPKQRFVTVCRRGHTPFTELDRALAVGRGEIDEEIVGRAIQNGDRNLAGPTAPAHGLTLKSVQYE